MTFNIGDRVKFIGNSEPWAGHVGIVTGRATNYADVLRVKFEEGVPPCHYRDDNGKLRDWELEENKFILIEDGLEQSLLVALAPLFMHLRMSRPED